MRTSATLEGWTPTEIVWNDTVPAIRWHFTDGIDFAEPFFRQSVERCLRDPFRLLFWRDTGVDQLIELSAERPGLELAGLVFHTSRCGSTLVAEMLRSLTTTLVVSEPDPVDMVLRARAHAPRLTDDEAVRWLRAMVAALTQPRAPGQHRAVVKLDAWAALEAPLVLEAFATTPRVFVYRDPTEVIASHLAQRGFHMIPGTLRPEQLGLAANEPFELAPEQYSAAVLARLCEIALAGARDGKWTLVNYRDLPEAVPAVVAPLFGIDVGADERGRVRAGRHPRRQESGAALRCHRLPAPGGNRRGAPGRRRARRRALRSARAGADGPDVARCLLGPDGTGRSAVTEGARMRLPLSFDPGALAAEAATLPRGAWVPHFNHGVYEGEWVGAALRSPGGDATRLYGDATGEVPYADTELLGRWPAHRAALGQFRCPITSARLLALAPGAVIDDHRDHTLSWADGEIRVHVPVVTAEGVEFFLDGRPVAMGLGEAWYLDLTHPHRAANRSSVTRIHLVVDCVVDAWLDEMLRAAVASMAEAPGEASGPAPAVARIERHVKAHQGRRSDGRDLGPTADARRLGDGSGLLDEIAAWLLELGLEVRRAPIELETVLPGITIEGGALVVDPSRCEHPGDLLHEAAHLAILSPEERSAVWGTTGSDGGFEMAAIAWSYAAAKALGLDASVVFHADGYRGGSAGLIDNFAEGRYVGVPVLQWLGLTAEATRAPPSSAWSRTRRWRGGCATDGVRRPGATSGDKSLAKRQEVG